MRLSSLVPSLPASMGERLREVVDELDKVIADIRTTIFDLQAQRNAARGLRRGVLQLTSDAAQRLDYRPRVHFEGAIDTAVDRQMADQLLAVLREALSNIIRHAGASAVDVTVAEESGALILTVADDGVGAGPEPGSTPVVGYGLRIWSPERPRSAAPARSGRTSPTAPSSSGGSRSASPDREGDRRGTRRHGWPKAPAATPSQAASDCISRPARELYRMRTPSLRIWGEVCAPLGRIRREFPPEGFALSTSRLACSRRSHARPACPPHWIERLNPRSRASAPR